MSGKVLDEQCDDKKVVQTLGISISRTVMDFHFVVQKSTTARHKHFDVQEKCTEFRGALGYWITWASKISVLGRRK